jgi:hypothetical protein
MKFVLVHDAARAGAIKAVQAAPAGHVVTVKPPTRTLAQNAKFHAMCDEFDGLPWYGKARNADDWKTLLVSGHTVATGGSVELGVGLEGELINFRESTATMSKARGSSLIEYTLAHTAQSKGFHL